MSLPAFTWTPDYAPQIDEEPAILETPFGDKYTQATGSGINNLQPKATFPFTNRSKAEFDAILAFLRARGGTEQFTFTAPHESVVRNWRCKSWKATPWQNGVVHSISATFEAQP